MRVAGSRYESVAGQRLFLLIDSLCSNIYKDTILRKISEQGYVDQSIALLFIILCVTKNTRMLKQPPIT